MSLGLSWPFFFLLKRLFTITINYSRTERMMRREGYNNSGRDCRSAVTPTVIVAIVTVIVVAGYCSCSGIAIIYFLCMIVMFLIIHLLLLSLSPTLKFMF